MVQGKKAVKGQVLTYPVEQVIVKTAGKAEAKGAASQALAPDIAAIKAAIEKKLKGKPIPAAVQSQILEQRQPAEDAIERAAEKLKEKRRNYLHTKVPGFDELIETGIPGGSAVVIAGGAGSGKTIFCLQMLYEAAKAGEKCLYMSFEESAEKLEDHMRDFGWDPDPLIENGTLIIQRFNPFDITRGVDALLLKAKGELLIDIKPVLLPAGFSPERVVVDSLTAIASAFSGKEDSYRIYVEQLFLFFEEMGTTSFLITETKQIPTIFSTTGVEEFLADGVIVMYNLQHGNIRENAIEVLKLRGTAHQKKIVAMQITDRGIEVFPEQEVFSAVENREER